MNIVDIVIVAKAFGSKPGDDNWNSVADLDDSHQVNIIDVAIATKDYGITL